VTTKGSAAFIGSIPENYDHYLGPMYFHHYADDLAARLPIVPGMRILETACGTGILTERLARRLHGHAALVATDLNEPMIAHASQKAWATSGVEWRQADATKLPLPDASFDAVICQFGLMFFSDKVAGLREAYRVLRAGGRHLFNVWDGFERNINAKIVHETIASFFPENPRTGESPSAVAAATGLVEGTPLYGKIMERRRTAVRDIEATLARNLAAAFGETPLRCPLRAFVFSATKPR
jgi:ubiquinone/menaquinone biosynthesis C-methylase UbiE